jgi:hypothetical protein
MESSCRSTVSCRHTTEEHTIHKDFNNEAYEKAAISEELYEVIGRYQGIYVPDGESDELDSYERAARARCMTCGDKLEEATIIIIDSRGIMGIWCSGQCLQDIHAISFLRQVEDHVLEGIESRTVSEFDEDKG